MFSEHLLLNIIKIRKKKKNNPTTTTTTRITFCSAENDRGIIMMDDNDDDEYDDTITGSSSSSSNDNAIDHPTPATTTTTTCAINGCEAMLKTVASTPPTVVCSNYWREGSLYGCANLCHPSCAERLGLRITVPIQGYFCSTQCMKQAVPEFYQRNKQNKTTTTQQKNKNHQTSGGSNSMDDWEDENTDASVWKSIKNVLQQQVLLKMKKFQDIQNIYSDNNNNKNHDDDKLDNENVDNNLEEEEELDFHAGLLKKFTKSLKHQIFYWMIVPCVVISASSYLSRFLPVNTIGQAVRYSHIIPQHDCLAMIAAAEEHASSKRKDNHTNPTAPTKGGGEGEGVWETDRHADYPTTDFALLTIPAATLLWNTKFKSKLLPLVAAQYNQPIEDIDFRDLFIVKYTGGIQGLQDELNVHRDGSMVSFNLALSSSSSIGDGEEADPITNTNTNTYEGGGTYFRLLDDIIKIDQGDILIHDSGLMHGGAKITKGKRYLIVGFMDFQMYNMNILLNMHRSFGKNAVCINVKTSFTENNNTETHGDGGDRDIKKECKEEHNIVQNHGRRRWWGKRSTNDNKEDTNVCEYNEKRSSSDKENNKQQHHHQYYRNINKSVLVCPKGAQKLEIMKSLYYVKDRAWAIVTFQEQLEILQEGDLPANFIEVGMLIHVLLLMQAAFFLLRKLRARYKNMSK